MTTCDRDRLAAWRVRGVSTPVLPLTSPSDPVGMDLFKLHARISDDAFDLAIIPFYLAAARDWVEAETGLAGLSQTWRYTIDGPPWGGTSLVLPMAPVVSITSVTSYDLTNVGTVMLNTTYLLDGASRPARLVLNDGISWPSGLRATSGLVIDYVAGHGSNVELVPARLRQAIALVAGEFYKQREISSDLSLKDLPFLLQGVIGGLKVYGPL